MMGFMREVAALRASGGISRDASLGAAVVASFARHTAGRDLMACVLEVEGFEVRAAGRSMSVEDVVGMCLDPDVSALCYSVQATYDCPDVLRVDPLLREAGIRDRIVFNAGGSPVSRGFAEKACCDVYAPTAVASARAIAEAVRKRRGGRTRRQPEARPTGFTPHSGGCRVRSGAIAQDYSASHDSRL